MDTIEASCPTCQKRGKRVEMVTIKALMAVPLNELHPTDYLFCATPDCDTVYFSSDGTHVLPEESLRERVFQKHPTDPGVLVCYCFLLAVKDIERDPEATTTEIKQGIKAELCACDIRNPQGSCCLGNVRQIEK